MILWLKQMELNHEDRLSVLFWWTIAWIPWRFLQTSLSSTTFKENSEIKSFLSKDPVCSAHQTGSEVSSEIFRPTEFIPLGQGDRATSNLSYNVIHARLRQVHCTLPSRLLFFPLFLCSVKNARRDFFWIWKKIRDEKKFTSLFYNDTVKNFWRNFAFNLNQWIHLADN